MQSITFRPLRADEFPHRFHDYRNPPTSGVGRRSRTFDEEVAAGGYRPEWSWVALRGDELVARAAFWAPPGAPLPWSVDLFDPGDGPDRIEVGAALLRAAYQQLVPADYRTPPQPEGGGRPDYHLFLPADWRDRPDAYAEATDRVTAAERAGLHYFVERLNLRWTPADGLPPRSSRLRFTPVAEDALLLDALARVSVDALDAYARRDVERLGHARAAELTLPDLAEMPGGRDWWRLAYHADGSLVGFVLPTRNPNSATIGYLGVVPEHRGHGYSDDLVTEAMHIFAEAGEPVVNDATDVGNVPMAAAFARLGYRVVGRRIILT